MKTLFLLSSVIVVLFLAGPKKAEAQKRRATNRVDRSANIALPGFYIKLSRCHTCVLSRRQQDALMCFRGRGISAFYGTPKYDESARNIEFLERLQGVHGFPTSLFVGPFQTEAAAQRVVFEVPSILRRQIAEDRSSSVGGPAESPSGFYEVAIVKVRSTTVTGSITRLPTEDFIIRPGTGVGRVLIGSGRNDVLAALGKPRDALAGFDTWGSAGGFLTVYYRSGTVRQIEGDQA